VLPCRFSVLALTLFIYYFCVTASLDTSKINKQGGGLARKGHENRVIENTLVKANFVWIKGRNGLDQIICRCFSGQPQSKQSYVLAVMCELSGDNIKRIRLYTINQTS